MKKIAFITLSLFMANSFAQPRLAVANSSETKKQMYPKTEKKEHIDIYFEKPYSDPYHWLEDDKSIETQKWVETQNDFTNAYLEKIKIRGILKEQLTKMWNYEKVGSPFKRGNYTYFYKNDGLQNQFVIYRKNEKGDEEVFLDPNTFSKDGTSSLGGISFSKDGSLVAYAVSEAGSDWQSVVFMDAEHKEILTDKLENVKFSGLSWLGNEGIYYSSYDKPTGSQLSAKTDQHKLYFHTIGTLQTADKVIFGDKQKIRYVGGTVTEDDSYLIVSGANSTSGNELYVKDLTNPKAGFVQIIKGFDYDYNFVDNIKSGLYIETNFKAPNKRVVKIDFNKPAMESWVSIIPETKNVLNASSGSGFLFANYLKDAVSYVEQYNFDGKNLGAIKLPGLGTISGFDARAEDELVYYSFSNYTTPGTIYSYNPKEQASELYMKPKIDFNSDNFVTEQVFYDSKDGTKIPMMITYKKGLVKNAKTPTILYGYGGFNISITPSFSVTNAVWMENGGIYAVANIRGGGEYGSTWHDDGTKMKKQNVFDDFIAAAEYLIGNKYTSSDYLAIRGGSNGGLLVGAVMTQRPDLVRVALPAVGVLDMLRYHTFTSGAGWAYDYGKSDDSKEMFNYLLGYSPVHNVKKGGKYPATLITTGDHDDRVVPAHSFKFAANLQEKQTGELPVMIRIDVKSGHGAGKSTAASIQENADIQAFTLYNMGIQQLPISKQKF